jgi:tRNA nucleotidyltransferase/poly(A) polymerase
VGGTVRDLLLGQEPHDIDLVTADDPEPLARWFADSIEGGFFILSEEFQACRAISADRRLNYDFSARRGQRIVEDLGDRDFTVNAMAVELPGGGGLIDPFGGAAHLAGRELVPVADSIFSRDPLRLLRAVRLEKTLGLVIGPALARLITSQAALASRPAVERLFFELSRLLEAPGAAASVRRLDELGLLEVLLPELSALKDITQNEFHHLDVYCHTLASVDELDRVITDPEAFFPGHGEKIRERIDQRIAGDAGCRLVLSLAALFHDVAKPNCRFTDEDGLVRFFEHDRLGAEMVGDILGRFKVSTEARQAVTQLVRRHMRFEALLQEAVPSDRARLRYLRATEPWSPESIMLSVSDRLAVRGPWVTEADIAHHLDLARGMMELALATTEAAPLPKLVDGDDLMRVLELEPGPLVGELLDLIHEEQQLGKITSREQALAIARALTKPGDDA